MADDERDKLLVAAMQAMKPKCRFRISGHDAPEPMTDAEEAAQCTYKAVSLGDFTNDGLRALIASLSDPSDKDAHLSCDRAYHEAIRNVYQAAHDQMSSAPNG